MKRFRKTILLAIITLFSVQIFYAQDGWKIVKDGGQDQDDLITAFFTSSKKGFVAGDKGYFSYTNDGGETWERQFVYTVENINEIYFRNDDDGYVVAGKKLFLTDDGGRSWREIKIYDQDEFAEGSPDFLSVRFADKNRGIIVGSVLSKSDRVIDSLVMLTEDGGKTWRRILVPFKDELYHLDFADDSRGWIVGDMGMILTTYDGGRNWQIQRSGVEKGLYNVDFRDKNDGIVVGSSGTILRTENGGETWQKVETNFPETFLRVDFATDKRGWTVGRNGTILRSSDKGKTWLKQDSRTNKHLYGLYMTKKYGWAVGEKGLILRYEN